MNKSELSEIVGEFVYLKVTFPSVPIEVRWILKNYPEPEREPVYVIGFEGNSLLIRHSSGLRDSIGIARIREYEIVK